MNILMNYIQIVLMDMKYQSMQWSLSTVELLTHPLSVLQIGVVIWVVVSISERKQ